MGAPSRQRKVEIAERRRRVVDLYVQGHKQGEIAIRLGINQSDVSKDLKAVQREWAEERLHGMDQLKQLQLEKVDRVEREAWTAWERSKGPIEVSEATLDGGKDKGRAKRVTKTTAGEPKFLLIVDRCIERRCKILGLEAPQKTALTDSQGQDLVSVDERVSSVMGLVDALRQRAGIGAAAAGSSVGEPGAVCSPGQPRPVANGSAPGAAGPGSN